MDIVCVLVLRGVGWALICLRDSYPSDKTSSPQRATMEPPSLALPQKKKAMILKFFGIHLGELPT